MGKIYKNPPVIEALCEFFFEGGKWDSSIPGLFHEQVMKEYPWLAAPNVEFVETIEGRRVLVKYRPKFCSPNMATMIQIERNLLVFNQLKPYTNFEEWKPKALKVFSIYKELCRVEKTCKMGVRYINEILIPDKAIQIEEYFLLYPTLPDRVSKAHRRFLLSFEIFMPDNHLVTVTLGSELPETTGSKFLLDIYDMVQCPIPFEEVEGLIIQAHDNIISAFENSITDKLRELFQEVK